MFVLLGSTSNHDRRGCPIDHQGYHPLHRVPEAGMLYNLNTLAPALHGSLMWTNESLMWQTREAAVVPISQVSVSQNYFDPMDAFTGTSYQFTICRVY